MQAVILAAGKGTRMNHLTHHTPKPMLNIGKMNLIEWKIEALPETINEVIMIVGYLGEKIKEHFGEHFAGKKITYIEQKELNGTGGALFLAKDILKDKFIVMNGDDIYSKEDITGMIDNGWSILAKKATEEGKGAKIVTNGDQTIKEIIENSLLKVGDWHNAGMYVLGEEIFNYPLMPIKNNEFGLPQTVVLASKDIPIRIVPAKRWLQVTSPQDISKVEQILTKKA